MLRTSIRPASPTVPFAVVVAIAWIATSGAACVNPLPLEDRPCPCAAPAWVCCQAICVPRDRVVPACSAAGDSESRASVPDAAASSPTPDAAPAEADAPPMLAEPDAAPDAVEAAWIPKISFVLPPEGGAISGSYRVMVVGGDAEVRTLELWVDGAIRNRASGTPTWIDWPAFRETLGAHARAAHELKVVAIDRNGQRYERTSTVRAVAPLRGDCDSNSVVDGFDVGAIRSEATDGDAGDPESTPEGTFLGSPACDVNDDNFVDMDDASCLQGLLYGPPGFTCSPPELPALRPILFLPVEYHHLSEDRELTRFLRDKLEEVRRFVARHNGKTFRALPVEVVRATRPRAEFVEGTTLNFETVLSQVPLPGYVESSNRALTPWNRVVWVIVMGGSASIESRRFANGHGFALMGDAYIQAARDLDCSRVNPVAAGDQVLETCLEVWLGRGNIYGHSMGRVTQALLAALGAPLLDPSSSGYADSVMGDYTRYPDSGLSDADRATFDVSHFFPGSRDRSAAVASILAPAAGERVSGTVVVRAAARDNYGIKSLTLSIDARQVHPMEPSWCPDSDNCARSPFEGDGSAIGMIYDWNTALERPGPHTITFRTVDVSGNTSEARTTVTVQ